MYKFMKKVFIITGEHSGDIHAAKVAEYLFAQNPDIIIEGIGGENLKSTGVKLFSDHKKMGAVGISPKIILDHISLGKRVVDYLTKEFKPDLVVHIDYGAFNLNVSKFLKRAGIKTYYYIPPQVWASRKWRINVIKKILIKSYVFFHLKKNYTKAMELILITVVILLFRNYLKKLTEMFFLKNMGLIKIKNL